MTVDRLTADRHGLVGGIGQYQNASLMAYLRRPENIIVSLAQQIEVAKRRNPRPNAVSVRLLAVQVGLTADWNRRP